MHADHEKHFKGYRVLSTEPGKDLSVVDPATKPLGPLDVVDDIQTVKTPFVDCSNAVMGVVPIDAKSRKK